MTRHTIPPQELPVSHELAFTRPRPSPVNMLGVAAWKTEGANAEWIVMVSEADAAARPAVYSFLAASTPARAITTLRKCDLLDRPLTGWWVPLADAMEALTALEPATGHKDGAALLKHVAKIEADNEAMRKQVSDIHILSTLPAA